MKVQASISAQFVYALIQYLIYYRAFTTKDIKVQVSNSAQFVDAWVRINVLDKRAQTLGTYFTNLLSALLSKARTMKPDFLDAMVS